MQSRTYLTTLTVLLVMPYNRCYCPGQREFQFPVRRLGRGRDRYPLAPAVDADPPVPARASPLQCNGGKSCTALPD